MIYPKPQRPEKSGYTSLHLNSCSDTSIVFDLLSDVPVTSERRYCNKVLVHECVTEPQSFPVELTSVEFIATSDPCYKYFEFYKRSDIYQGDQPSVVLHDTDDSAALTEAIEVLFTKEDLCCKPLRLSYRLYATFTETEERKLISSGLLYITPCSGCECSDTLWTDAGW
jgi:hypothetical protein